MTTDLVERLRAIPHIMGEARLCREAADEIERLRRELSYHAHTDEDIKVQNAEIERLRGEIEQYRERLGQDD